MLIRDAFALDPADPLVAAFQECYRGDLGLAAAHGPQAVRRRRQQLLGAGGIPAITHGPRAGGQHTVSEWVEIDDLVRVAMLYAATALVCILPIQSMKDATMMATTTVLPDLIAEAQTTEEAFLRQIFVRDQMAEWSKQPLVMARADGVYYWDVAGQALSRRDLGHLRRLGRAQQPPGDRGDQAAARRR